MLVVEHPLYGCFLSFPELVEAEVLLQGLVGSEQGLDPPFLGSRMKDERSGSLGIRGVQAQYCVLRIA
jgi:hypothetical protein